MTENLEKLGFHKARNVWYIKFVKNHQKFEVTAETLEDAIDMRDRVRDFIAAHDRIPKFEEIDYVPRPRGPKPTPKQTYRYECSRCNRVTETRRKETYSDFLKSDRLCGQCRVNDAMQRRIAKDIPSNSNKLGERNIWFDDRMNRYMIGITRSGESFTCSAESLEDAISIKKSVLEFIDSNGRVPTNVEGAEMFGYDTRKSRGSLEPRKSQVSSTGERNISAESGKGFYKVQISRAGRKFAMTIRNLEHAKILRNEVYDYYRSHGMLPKTEEFLERRNQLNDEID